MRPVTYARATDYFKQEDFKQVICHHLAFSLDDFLSVLVYSFSHERNWSFCPRMKCACAAHNQCFYVGYNECLKWNRVFEMSISI